MSKQITITLSDDVMSDVKSVMNHRRGNASEQTVITDTIKQGLYQFLYRYERNKTKWQETKDMKALLGQLLEERNAMKQKLGMKSTDDVLKTLQEDDDIIARD